jgi:anti-sigma regulatory factor (Ser/Thr protein kinase)
MPDAATLSLTRGRAEVSSSTKWFESTLLEMKVPEAIRWDLLLVFEEILVNVVEHAYVGRAGAVEIRVDCDGTVLQLAVIDQGIAFDPLAKEPPVLDAPAGERPIGGLGIHLVKTLCDEAEYRREGESNILTVRKRLG